MPRVTTYTLRKGSPAKTRTDVVVVGVVRSRGGDVRVAPGGEDVAAAYGRRDLGAHVVRDLVGQAAGRSRLVGARRLGARDPGRDDRRLADRLGLLVEAQDI